MRTKYVLNHDADTAGVVVGATANVTASSSGGGGGLFASVGDAQGAGAAACDDACCCVSPADGSKNGESKTGTAAHAGTPPTTERKSRFHHFGRIFKPWKWKRKKKSDRIEKTAIGKEFMVVFCVFFFVCVLLNVWVLGIV
jgi:hypothetical protein